MTVGACWAPLFLLFVTPFVAFPFGALIISGNYEVEHAPAGICHTDEGRAVITARDSDASAEFRGVPFFLDGIYQRDITLYNPPPPKFFKRDEDTMYDWIDALENSQVVCHSRGNKGWTDSIPIASGIALVTIGTIASVALAYIFETYCGCAQRMCGAHAWSFPRCSSVCGALRGCLRCFTCHDFCRVGQRPFLPRWRRPQEEERPLPADPQAVQSAPDCSWAGPAPPVMNVVERELHQPTVLRADSSTPLFHSGRPKHAGLNLNKKHRSSSVDSVKNACPICFAESKACALIPCGHCFCAKCAAMLFGESPAICPLCRRLFKSTQKVFV